MSAESRSQEQHLVTRLQARDEAAFADLVTRWTSHMINLAAAYVPNRQVAEEVVQDAWLAVVRGIDKFEGRSSLRTWVFLIVIRRAREVGGRERRSLPFTAVWRDEHAPALDPTRFHPDTATSHAGGWISPVPRWDLLPDEKLRSAEVRALIDKAIADLPPRQRQVMMARDVWGCDGDEACSLLGITANHQRVLLHRARAKVRAVLEVSLRDDLTGGAS